MKEMSGINNKKMILLFIVLLLNSLRYLGYIIESPDNIYFVTMLCLNILALFVTIFISYRLKIKSR